MIIVAYLGAIVAANLLVAHFGQEALLVTATVLIPFDLTARDVLHERWSEAGKLRLRMALLVLSGSAITAAMNIGAARVAIASAVAFAVAATVDAVVYSAAANRSRMFRMNASNAASATLDSVVFPLIAFGAIEPALSASQAMLKVAGGAAWAFLLGRVLSRRNHAHHDEAP